MSPQQESPSFDPGLNPPSEASSSESTWLCPLQARWREPQLSRLPSWGEGEYILAQLLEDGSWTLGSEDIENFGMEDVCSTAQKPSLKLAFDHLLASGTAKKAVCTSYGGESRSGWSRGDVFANLLASSQAKFAEDLVSVSHFPFLRGEGSHPCDIHLPHVLQGTTTPGGEEIVWEYTVSPAGFVHPPRMLPTTEVVVHVSGHSLWLVWTLTPENIACFRRAPPSVNAQWAMENLHGLSIIHLTEPGGFLIPPFFTFSRLVFDLTVQLRTSVTTYRHLGLTFHLTQEEKLRDLHQNLLARLPEYILSARLSQLLEK